LKVFAVAQPDKNTKPAESLRCFLSLRCVFLAITVLVIIASGCADTWGQACNCTSEIPARESRGGGMGHSASAKPIGRWSGPGVYPTQCGNKRAGQPFSPGSVGCPDGVFCATGYRTSPIWGLHSFA